MDRSVFKLFFAIMRILQLTGLQLSGVYCTIKKNVLQIVWFCKELVKNTVTGADSVCTSLIRQMAGNRIKHSIHLFVIDKSLRFINNLH
jgi:hypothetical protein